MPPINKRLIAGSIIVILAGTGLVMDSHKAAAQGPPTGVDVRVVSPLPLPVTGSTTVSGTVAATQSGGWTVGVNGTPSVRVSSTGTNPAITEDVSHFASAMVTLRAYATSANESGVFQRLLPDASVAPFQVPSGYSFVLTNVDVSPADVAALNGSVATGVTDILLQQTIGSSGTGLFQWRIRNDQGTTQFRYPSGIVFAAGSSFGMIINSAASYSALRIVFLNGYLSPN